MRRDHWLTFPVMLAVYVVSIAVMTVYFGVWAGVAAWLLPPAVFGVIVIVAGALESRSRSARYIERRDARLRHPSSGRWGNMVDITDERSGKR